MLQPPFEPPQQPFQPPYQQPYPPPDQPTQAHFTQSYPSQPGQFQPYPPGSVPPVQPPKKKRRTGCIIAGSIAGGLIFLLTTCIIIGSFLPAPPASSTPQVQATVTPTLASTQNAQAQATAPSTPTISSTPTPIASVPTPTPVPTPVPPTPTLAPTEVTHQIGALNGVDIGAGSEQWQVGVQTVKVDNGPILGSSQTNFKEYSAKAGNHFLTVTIFMQNKGPSPQPITNEMWRLESLDKKGYPSLEGIGLDAPSMQRGIFPGKTMYAEVEYEVPVSVTTFRLLFFLKPESKPIIFQFEAK